jgi:hypothetical protein
MFFGQTTHGLPHVLRDVHCNFMRFRFDAHSGIIPCNYHLECVLSTIDTSRLFSFHPVAKAGGFSYGMLEVRIRAKGAS